MSFAAQLCSRSPSRGGNAHAGPISDCYDDAEADNSGLSFTLKVNGSTYATTSSISGVGQFTARFHSNSTMEVQANSAGTQALKDTLNCLLGEGVVTHSSMILNTMSAYKVRTNDLEKDSVIYDLSSVVLPGDGVRYAKFLSQSTYDTAMVPLTAYGSYDATYTWTTDSITCRATEACGDYCVEECTPPDPTGCECAGAESGCIVDLNNVVASTASYMEI